MFELFAGRPPFTGNSENELLNKHLRTPAPSAETYNKNLTYECVQLVKSMLAKNSDDRPESMDDVLGASASQSRLPFNAGGQEGVERRGSRVGDLRSEVGGRSWSSRFSVPATR